MEGKMPEALAAQAPGPRTPGGEDSPLTSEDRAFAAAFAGGTLEEFHHADHVRLAWIYLLRYPVLEALERFVAGIRRFAAANGKPDLYHETITWAYLLVIHERLERTGREMSWEEFAAANPDLLVWKGGILERWYRPETLASDVAKRVFVWPDRAAV